MTPDSGGGRGVAANPAAAVLALAVVAATAAGVPALAQVGAPSGDRILEDARERYAAAETVAGTATVTVTNGSEARTFEVAFAATDDGEYRVTVDGPRGTVVAGSNGSVRWVHSERTGLTRVYTADELEGGKHVDGGMFSEAVPAEALPANSSWDAEDLRALAWDWTRENTTAERVGTETLDGRKAFVVRVEPDDERRDGTLTVWVAADTSTVLKQRLVDEERTATVRFTEVRFDVSMADSTFRPPTAAPPDLATTVDSFDELQAATSLDLPRLDAAGYEFAGGSTLTYGGATAAVQRYAGPAAVTLVTTTAERVPGLGGAASAAEAPTGESATVAGVSVTVAETERGVAVSWTEDGVRHVLVSEQSREAVLELAASVIAGDGEP